jgi:dolichyl-phosphate-mannose-protein mannosyltransferase
MRDPAMMHLARHFRTDAEHHSWVHTASLVILSAMIAAGVLLRSQGIGAPAYFTFDEHEFVPNAFNYLAGQADLNDHPPLGKLFIAAGIALLGYNSVGWRFASLCLGIQLVVIAYRLGRELFGSSRAGLFAAALVAVDGFFIAYSRTALLDGVLCCFVLWSFLAATTARTGFGVLWSAVLAGLATSIKWSGVMVAIPAVVAILVLRRVRPSSVWIFATVPLVHAALWIVALRITGEPADLQGLWSAAAWRLEHHLWIANEQNELASPWYSWLYLYHPIVVKLSSAGYGHRYASSVGNVLVWLSSTALVIAILLTSLGRAASARLRGLASRLVPQEFAVPALLLCAGWFALLVPWIVGRGQYTFLYHYLPSYGFAVVLVGGALSTAERRVPRFVLGFLCAAWLVAIYYAPVWGEFTLNTAGANRRLIFQPWRP